MSDTNGPESGAYTGQPLKRREDGRMLRGDACFTDDIDCPDALYGVVVRSPYPHARVLAIDVAAAQASPGVRLVLTSQSIVDDVVGPIPSLNDVAPFDVRNDDGNTVPNGSAPVLAEDRVCYVGEPVAFVVAETELAAIAAAELVQVEYDPLQPLMDFDTAVAPGAPGLWSEAPANRSLDMTRGNDVESQFESASTIVDIQVDVNRIVPAFMEPRSALGRFDPAAQRYFLQTGTQSAHALKGNLSLVLGVPGEQIKVEVPDMGGGFGARNVLYPEFLLVLIAAKKLSTPVRWTSTRSEAFLTDAQCRDHVITGSLALDEDNRFLALRVELNWQHGAYLCSRNAAVVAGFFPPTNGGVYRLPAVAIKMNGAFTNTTPQAAFRGIGRVESNYLIERLVDKAARTLGVCPLKLRRDNMLTEHDLPWKTPGGSRYTSGEFEVNLDRAMELSSFDACEQRRADAKARGMLHGVGVGMYVENDGASPSEYANVDIDTDQKIVSFGVGTQDFGMGHQTMMSQIAADALGLTPEDVTIFFGDTDRIKQGFGSAGSRTARLGGSAVFRAAHALIEKARIEAGELFETSVEDIEYDRGALRVTGTDRHINLIDLAVEVKKRDGSMSTEAEFVSTEAVHQNGCQICEVEVDPQTGVVTIKQHTIVADVGRAINPMIVDGQLHGGMVQGLGQAGYEHVVYDAAGQTVTGSFMDYTIPKADDMPMFTTELNEVIESDNPVGAKGAGEGPTSGAPAAYVNAVIDALSPLGVTELDMPLTPQRVWQAIQAASAARA